MINVERSQRTVRRKYEEGQEEAEDKKRRFVGKWNNGWQCHIAQCPSEARRQSVYLGCNATKIWLVDACCIHYFKRHVYS